MDPNPCPRVAVPLSVFRPARVAVLVAVLAALSVFASPPLRAIPNDPDFCLGKPNGTLCSVEDETLGDCTVFVCRDHRCDHEIPAPTNQACDDTDGNLCTTARCVPNTGTCNQSAPADPNLVCPDDLNVCTRPTCDPTKGVCQHVAQNEGRSCSSADPPEFCPDTVCRLGACVPAATNTPIPDVRKAVQVEVETRPVRVTESEAFNDCCTFCQDQSLEAWRPTPFGPLRTEPDDGLPFRRRLCGRLAGEGIGFGVNDERDEPRDLLFNIVPAAGFEDFVAGQLHNACSKMNPAQRERFEVGEDEQCEIGACHAAAEQANADPDLVRCIHTEVTPPEQFYRQDRIFLPIDSSGPCSNEPSEPCVSRLEQAAFGIGDVCVYGVYSLDHADHRAEEHKRICCVRDFDHDYMEMHPIDAVWWRHPAKDGFMFAVFQDASDRFSVPHCRGETAEQHHNGNLWSQPPRDVTFKFPFRFFDHQVPTQACIRYARTQDFTGAGNDVEPMHVSTAFVSDPLSEVKLLGDGSRVVLEIVEPKGHLEETQVRVDGCVLPEEIRGVVTLRVAVGCTQGMDCELIDRDNPGHGFYYGEIYFAKDCDLVD